MANIATKSNSGWQYIEKENLLHVLFEEEFSEDEAKKYSHYFRPLKLGYQQWLALAVLKFRRNGIKSRNEIPFLHQLYLDIIGEGGASVRVNGEGEGMTPESSTSSQKSIKKLISKIFS